MPKTVKRSVPQAKSQKGPKWAVLTVLSLVIKATDWAAYALNSTGVTRGVPKTPLNQRRKTVLSWTSEMDGSVSGHMAKWPKMAEMDEMGPNGPLGGPLKWAVLTPFKCLFCALFFTRIVHGSVVPQKGRFGPLLGPSGTPPHIACFEHCFAPLIWCCFGPVWGPSRRAVLGHLAVLGRFGPFWEVPECTHWGAQGPYMALNGLFWPLNGL